ncbi:hypothetical protein ACSAZK_00475 [Methanosarcina sp. Mfa9]|uniref:hypothetical protein n=1 Tax=Methanosarcina sp. Mfa9 TaxID=3439063 RepID=UPI003F835D60
MNEKAVDFGFALFEVFHECGFDFEESIFQGEASRVEKLKQFLRVIFLKSLA